MDEAALAWTLFGVTLGLLGGGLISVWVAWLTGAIAPGSRVDRAEEAAKILREAYDTLKIPVTKFDIESDLVGAILRANHAVAAGTVPPPLPPTTTHTG